MAAAKTAIACTICGTPTDFFTAPLGPFCSLRCQRADLGRWLGEDYRISEPLQGEDLEQWSVQAASEEED